MRPSAADILHVILHLTRSWNRRKIDTSHRPGDTKCFFAGGCLWALTGSGWKCHVVIYLSSPSVMRSIAQAGVAWEGWRRGSRGVLFMISLLCLTSFHCLLLRSACGWTQWWRPSAYCWAANGPLIVTKRRLDCDTLWFLSLVCFCDLFAFIKIVVVAGVACCLCRLDEYDK